jgi:hypothetical protein
MRLEIELILGGVYFDIFISVPYIYIWRLCFVAHFLPISVRRVQIPDFS